MPNNELAPKSALSVKGVSELQIDKKLLENDVIFFFMPHRLVMTAEKQGDAEEDKILRKVCPYYYWCSAHEFKNIEAPDKKFLFQYQTYFPEGFGAKASDVVQKWADNKGELRNFLQNFLDLWVDHKRVLLDPFDLSQATGHTAILDPNNFGDFGEAVGSGISGTQHDYWKQNVNDEYDVKQKHFWRAQAIYNNREEFMKILANTVKKSDTKEGKKRGRKPNVPKSESTSAK